MPDQIVQFKTTTPAKLTTSLLVLLALIASWFVVRWYVGNTIAEYFQAEEHRLETAQMAVSLAPSDPLPHWRVGNLVQKESTPDQIYQVVAEYEKAVALSPNDYRFWMSFGEALEQAGEYDRAEKALRQSVKLAPSYAYPRWLLGNLLVRTDRYSEGFAELRLASQADEEFQGQLFNLAWQLNKDDSAAMVAAIGQNPGIRGAFASYLLKRGRFDEGLRLWNGLRENEKRAQRFAADGLIGSLIAAKRFHQAAQVWNEVAPGPNYLTESGHVADGSFESNVAHGPNSIFGWQVQQAQQVQIAIDPNLGHSGNRSLRIYFQVRSHLKAINLAQLVPVQPNTEYDFECYMQTERLESASTPNILIQDASDDSILGTSDSAPIGNTNWQRIGWSFKTGPKTEAIFIKVVRNLCPDSEVCPIFGTVWYDDFDLKPRK